MHRESNSQYPIVKVEGLTVYQDKYLALRDVSFELLSGTDTAVVGPNGAGKSTLVQALLGIIPHTSGKIEIFGRPVTRLGRLSDQIGYMPQNFIFDRSFPAAAGALESSRAQLRQFLESSRTSQDDRISSNWTKDRSTLWVSS